MIVHMIGLYIRLVTYIRLHIALLCTTPFPLHTLIRSLLTTLDSHVQDFFLDTFLYCSGIRVIVRITRSWSLSYLDYWYSCFFIHIISRFYLYRIQLSFSFVYSSVIIVLDIYMSYCSDIDLS